MHVTPGSIHLIHLETGKHKNTPFILGKKEIAMLWFNGMFVK